MSELKPLIVSPSWLSLYLDCPQKHDFHYGQNLGSDGGSAAQWLGKAVHKASELYLVPQPAQSGGVAALLHPALVPEYATKDYPDSFPNAKEWRTKGVAQGVIRALAERHAILTPAELAGAKLVEVAVQRPVPINATLPSGRVLLDMLAGAGYSGISMLCIVDAIIKQGDEYLVWERKTTGSTRIGEDGMPYVDPEKTEAGRNSLQVALECWSASGLLKQPVTKGIFEIVAIAKPLKSEPNRPRVAFDYALVEYGQAEQEQALDEVRDTVQAWLAAKARGRFCRNTGNCHNFNSTCQYWELCSSPCAVRQQYIDAFPHADPKAREARHATLKKYEVSA